jgi:two-component system nitrate/nitrite response regulator NarL
MKLLIVDDHAVVREGVATLLRQLGPDTKVLQARDGNEGLACAEAEADLDAVFLDLNLPGLDGRSAIQEFGKRRPDLPVIVLSSSEDPGDVRNALAAGALGYIPKSATPQTLLSALQLVLSGNVYIPPLMLNAASPGAANPRSYGGGVASLSARQTDILSRICRGLSNKEISRELDLSEKTVKAHITAIFKVLNVVSRSQAASVARQANLV